VLSLWAHLQESTPLCVHVIGVGISVSWELIVFEMHADKEIVPAERLYTDGNICSKKYPLRGMY
jgi:hypothetical protein